jgi:hypothetical protein
MEMTSKNCFSKNISTIRRGHYSLLNTSLKLQILEELLDESIATADVEENFEKWIDQQQALAATKRETAIKDKEEQKLNMEGATEMETNHTESIPDVKESVNGQLVAKEGMERKHCPCQKIGRWEIVSGGSLYQCTS